MTIPTHTRTNRANLTVRQVRYFNESISESDGFVEFTKAEWRTCIEVARLLLGRLKPVPALYAAYYIVFSLSTIEASDYYRIINVRDLRRVAREGHPSIRISDRGLKQSLRVALIVMQGTSPRFGLKNLSESELRALNALGRRIRRFVLQIGGPRYIDE